MAGSTNFLQWDELQENMLSDVDYASSDMRVGGIKPNVRMAAPSNLHNKLYHQLAIMVAALARSLANRGYNVKDDNINTLVAILDDILTRADADFDLYLHKNKVGEMLLQDVLVKDGVKIDGRDISMDGAKLDSLSGDLNVQQSLTLNGYRKLPGGLILQWGRYGTSINSETTISVIFPIEFPNACLNASATGIASSIYSDLVPQIDPTTTKGTLVVRTQGISDLHYHLDGFYWFAIGY